MVSNMKVILYTTGDSIYCDMARDFLKKNKIRFEERRIDLNGKHLEGLLKIVPDDGVPTLVVDGKVYRNFNGEELEKIFKVKKSNL